MGSTRLPGKIMKDLAGKPILWHVINRVAMAKNVDKIVVATTANPEDNIVENFCINNNFLFYRGSADDVLGRYYEAARIFGGDIIVRVTADCPLVDPNIIDLNIKTFKKIKCDYISDVPPGDQPSFRNQDVEVISFYALKTAFKNATNNLEREHVTPYIWHNKHKEFIIGPFVVVDSKYNRDYRLVVDYPEDFELLEKIYKKFYNNQQIVDILEVYNFLDNNSEWLLINKHCKQKSLI